MAIEIILPENGSEVCLQNEMQKKFLAQVTERAELVPDVQVRWYAPERSWGDDFSGPEGVRFVWEDTDPCGGEYRLSVSTNTDLSDARDWTTDQTELTVYNLMIDTVYYAKIFSDNGESPTVSFRTSDTVPRTLRVPNVSNIRDGGGWRVPGGRIRQGMIYRGGEFETHMNLTPEGGAELIRLGIRTELDMRIEASDLKTTAAEAYGVRRVFIPLPAYHEFLNDSQTEACRRFFSVFADRSAYPIYYHCWGGADRTATVAFLLGALCGMSRTDLIDDYEFTSLSIWGVRSRNLSVFKEFVRLFDEFPGRNDREKALHFFTVKLGMDAEQVMLIRDILVEEV